MHDETPGPYGQVTRRWTQLSEPVRDREARRLIGVPYLQAGIDRPDATTASHYQRLVNTAVTGDEIAIAWLATSHRPLLLARGRALFVEDEAEWGAAALEVLEVTLHRADTSSGRWLRSQIAQRLASRMSAQVRHHLTRRNHEQVTDPAVLHLHAPAASAPSSDEPTELAAALADLLGRLDAPTREGLCALADRRSLETVAAQHELSHAALRQRVTRARHQLQPALATFLRTAA
jgi:hypothetical protein